MQHKLKKWNDLPSQQTLCITGLTKHCQECATAKQFNTDQISFNNFSESYEGRIRKKKKKENTSCFKVELVI